MTKKASAKGHLPLQCLCLALLLAVGIVLLWQAGIRFSEAQYPLKYNQEVAAAAEEFGLAPSLLYAVIHTESEFDPHARSAADAKGLMQLKDDTYRWALQREGKPHADQTVPLDPMQNIRYGAYVLTLLGEQFSHPDTVLAAYNAGQGHVQEWLDDPQYSADGITLTTIPFPETAQYVQRVNQARKYYQELYKIN